MCAALSPRARAILEPRAVYPYMFDKKGQIIIDKEECDLDADDLMMMALDAGAEDFTEEEDILHRADRSG